MLLYQEKILMRTWPQLALRTASSKILFLEVGSWTDLGETSSIVKCKSSKIMHQTTKKKERKKKKKVFLVGGWPSTARALGNSAASEASNFSPHFKIPINSVLWSPHLFLPSPAIMQPHISSAPTSACSPPANHHLHSSQTPRFLYHLFPPGLGVGWGGSSMGSLPLSHFQVWCTAQWGTADRPTFCWKGGENRTPWIAGLLILPPLLWE